MCVSPLNYLSFNSDSVFPICVLTHVCMMVYRGRAVAPLRTYAHIICAAVVYMLSESDTTRSGYV